MATKTLGTNATTSLTAIAEAFGASEADIAAIANIIKDDQNAAHPVIPASFTRGGLLYVPNRGVLKVLPGDWVGVDNRGWPILVSSDSIANGAWTHS